MADTRGKSDYQTMGRRQQTPLFLTPPPCPRFYNLQPTYKFSLTLLETDTLLKLSLLHHNQLNNDSLILHQNIKKKQKTAST